MMRVRKVQLIKISTILYFMVVFCLLLLPCFLVAIYPKENRGESVPEKVEYDQMITVFRTESGQTERVSLEDYVAGVVAGEMPSSFEMEALKAQAVAARTYAISKIQRSGDSGFPKEHPMAALCDSTHCQVYRTPKELLELKSEEWMESGWAKIKEAAEETRGQLMYYQGSLVEQPLFHSSSGGKTENSEDVFVAAVPYLRSVDSPYEQEATHQSEKTFFTWGEFQKKLKSAYPKSNFGTLNANSIKIISRSQGGRVEKIQVGNEVLEGRNIRDACNLYSANFNIERNSSGIEFTTMGYGHGVGMSQWGANGMAENGSDYREILTHYYSGVEIY